MHDERGGNYDLLLNVTAPASWGDFCILIKLRDNKQAQVAVKALAPPEKQRFIETAIGRARNRAFKHSRDPTPTEQGQEAQAPCPGWGLRKSENLKI
jgi:hypothetical protein